MSHGKTALFLVALMAPGCGTSDFAVTSAPSMRPSNEMWVGDSGDDGREVRTSNSGWTIAGDATLHPEPITRGEWSLEAFR